MQNNSGLVIVGAGQAGSELALAARQQGWTHPILLLGDEPDLPYQRPPLSKTYLCGKSDFASLALRQAAAYEAACVSLRLGARLKSIHRQNHTIELEDGEHIPYSKLALCTGGRARPWICEGMNPLLPPTNLLTLRTRADADAMRAALRAGTRLVVVGGGYVGLEVAASARTLGVHVTVLEAQPRVLARVAGQPLSDFITNAHRAAGVDVKTGAEIHRVVCENNSIVRVELVDGNAVPADVVVAGIGMLPNTEAAIAAGLATNEGIPVDELSATADPDIVAAGDCTFQHIALYDQHMRLESVPNALEQARSAAAWICGQAKPNQAVPWFWSDQYDLKLQLVGLSQGHDRCVVRGQPEQRSFCLFYLRGNRILAADAVNRPADFMQVRRALGSPHAIHVDPEALADESVPLKVTLAPQV
ncbi:MAG: FAD-dependent oxidoreductase [Hydrogenophaga sp.]|uniref:NAD(P)/FAD-dependent oxidoreductase n=1 Tax=Hydrogenophaga sp. TaxID=1904254 RepID=UPI002ABA2259|nr:FAD-dependent oxidoreductase [Hydrogenophaga sp.]MDZ4173121.1 FAD-dependent oxidoreductase [Hydrogenophaga sp.]